MKSNMYVSVYKVSDGWEGVLSVDNKQVSTAGGHTRAQVVDMLLDAARTWVK
jgi:hypothetical protein